MRWRNVAAEKDAKKCHFGPSGVKTPEGNADFMSCLKARPTKRETFSATCEAAIRIAFLQAGLSFLACPTGARSAARPKLDQQVR
jgi:hypothetical protein